jgi:hypothetical protein
MYVSFPVEYFIYVASIIATAYMIKHIDFSNDPRYDKLETFLLVSLTAECVFAIASLAKFLNVHRGY